MHSEQSRYVWMLAAALLMQLVVLGGCGNLSSSSVGLGRQGVDGTASEVEAVDFEGIRLPSDSEVNYDDSLVFGQGAEWFGRLAVRSSLDENELIAFFRTNLAQLGWREISAVRSENSVVVFARDERMLTLEIASGGLGGSSVTILISPMASGSLPSLGG